MTARHGIIDLDVPDGQLGVDDGGGPAEDWVRRKAALYLTAVFVLGVMLGGVGGVELWKSREERIRADTVTFVAMPGSYSGGAGSDRSGAVRLDTQLVLVNTGLVPMTVGVEGAQRPGVLMRGVDQSRLVRPGGTGWVNVEVTLECAIAFAPEPLPVSFSVETADHQVRQMTYPIALRGSPWQQQVQPMCEPPTVRAQERVGR